MGASWGKSGNLASFLGLRDMAGVPSTKGQFCNIHPLSFMTVMITLLYPPYHVYLIFIFWCGGGNVGYGRATTTWTGFGRCSRFCESGWLLCVGYWVCSAGWSIKRDGYSFACSSLEDLSGKGVDNRIKSCEAYLVHTYVTVEIGGFPLIYSRMQRLFYKYYDAMSFQV